MRSQLWAAFLMASASGLAAAPHTDWPRYCGNLSLNGVAQSGGSISADTAPTFREVWSTRLDGPIASAPAIAGDRVYVGDWSGLEYALDADTGAIRASAFLGTSTNPACQPATIGITSSATVADGVVYLAGGDDSFYALDAQTLETIWRSRLGDNSPYGGYYGWSSPAVVEGRILQGVSSNCDSPLVSGRVVDLDRNTGRTRKQTYLIYPEWPHDAVGAGVWTSPSIDIPGGKIFVTTGSADNIEDGLAFSIVRLSLDTLEVEESWKIDPGDQLDADWGSSPTLFRDENERSLVGAGQKDGHYYAFRRDKLAAGPVWRTALAKEGACPTCADGILSTAAFDGTRLYVGTGRPLASPVNLGSVTALNPATGAVLWQHPLDAPVIAPISYTNGVVFATAGRHAVALDARTGRELWSFATFATCVGGIAITDRGIFFGDLGGHFYAFATVGYPLRRRVAGSGP